MRPLPWIALSLLVATPAARAQSTESSETDPPPSRRSVEAHRARVRAGAYRPYFSGSGTSITRASASEVAALRRAARNKTYIPSSLDKLMEWTRVGVNSLGLWERDGGWMKGTVWENPSLWKGATMDQTVTGLGGSRGRTTSWAEKHPVRATYGTNRNGKR